MFLISVRFRASRGQDGSGKAGVVFFRIREKPGTRSIMPLKKSESPQDVAVSRRQILGKGVERSAQEDGAIRVAQESGVQVMVAQARRSREVAERCVNSDVRGYDVGVLHRERDRIVRQLRLLYCVIEGLAEDGWPFGVDDVVRDFRRALAGEKEMTWAVARSRVDFPLRADLVSVGREFKGCFKFVTGQPQYMHKGDLMDYIMFLSESMKVEGRHSRARSFRNLYSNLREFTGGEELLFSALDHRFIQEYAEWLKSTGIAESTQSFYLRTLRAALNRACQDGISENMSAWFRDVNTKIYLAREGKEGKGLDRDTLLRLEKTDLSGDEHLALARDMFLFGFYCGGMELIDIAHLTKENLSGGYLVYRRRLKGVQKRVPLGEQARSIIERYRGNGDRHLFPLLDWSGNVTFGTVRNLVSRCMKAIGGIIGIPKLAFGMNVATCNAMASQVNIPELLLKHVANV